MTLQNLKWAGAIVAGSFLLSFLGLYNGYPFVYPDTGSYVFSGFQGEVPIDRPITYGLFIRHSSMAESLFWVMYAQGFLTSLVIYFLLRQIYNAITPFGFIGLLLVLSACTSISFYTSFLTPDLFTPIFWASLAVLLFGNLSLRNLIVVAFLGWFALIMHSSTLVAAVVFTILLVVASLSGRFRAVIPFKKTLQVGALTLVGWLSVMSIHVAFKAPFAVQQAGPAFFLGRLNEIGLLKPHLEKACADGKNYPICKYKDQIPDDFLWGQDSPSRKDGGWVAHKSEYQDIIWNILTTPRDLKNFAIFAVNGTLMQLAYFRIEDTGPMREETPPYEAVKKYFPRELVSYKLAHQHHRNHFLDFSGLNTRQQYLFFGFILLLAGVWHPRLRRHMARPLPHMLIFCGIALLINAFVCSTFSTVVSRYQGRLLWLAILVELVAIIQIGMHWYAERQAQQKSI